MSCPSRCTVSVVSGGAWSTTARTAAAILSLRSVLVVVTAAKVHTAPDYSPESVRRLPTNGFRRSDRQSAGAL